jgi:hypothetical protein
MIFSIKASAAYWATIWPPCVRSVGGRPLELLRGGGGEVAEDDVRALGPALVAWQWNAHAVYWIGPLIGAGVAGALWKAILLPRA